MSSLTFNALPEVINFGDGLTVSRESAVEAAGYVIRAQRLITGDSVGEIGDSLDLALYRLIDMLGGDHERFARLADDLLAAAIEEGLDDG